MSEIVGVHAREILDSRGNPTVEVEVYTASGALGRAAVPSGASTGAHEAHELRDGDAERYGGKGVQKAVDNINNELADKLLGQDVLHQTAIDQILIEHDGSENKSNMGANALLGISLAAAKAGAEFCQLPIYQYVGGSQAHRLPVPLMNILNGGAHANNGLDVQEFMIAPLRENFSESLRAGSEIFQALKKIIDSKGLSTSVGDEGGFAPNLENNKAALDLISEAVEKTGYRLGEDIVFALDVAATELHSDGKYTWDGKEISSEELGEIYASWAKDYPLYSIEDGFDEDDWEGWINFTKAQGDKIQLVGDDLFVTNPKRLADGIEQGAANALLVKVNQIGTLSETHEAVSLAQRNRYRTVMSHRSGETEDTTIADLAVAMSCQQIKTGSLCRGERTAKYNQLLRIEEELGATARYWGAEAFR